MKTLITVNFLIFFLSSIGQTNVLKPDNYLGRITYPDCNYIPFHWEDGSHKISYALGNDDLTAYFTNRILPDKLSNITGKVGVQILLNKDGKSCCRALYIINGKIDIEKFQLLQLDSIVNTMPDWVIKKPSHPDVKGGNYCVILDIFFEGKRGIEVYYNPNRRIRFIN